MVERNLPPEPPRRASAIKLDTNDLLKSDDATPLGVDVRAIVLIGANAGAKPLSGATGVDVSEVSGIDAAALREQLTPFVDRPLSRKVVADWAFDHYLKIAPPEFAGPPPARVSRLGAWARSSTESTTTSVAGSAVSASSS